MHAAGERGADLTNPPTTWATTSADLLLVVTASPAAPTVAVQIELTHAGDIAEPAAFEIDVGNDGSVEANTSSIYCCGTQRRWFTTADAAAAPLQIRIRDTAGSSYGPQGFGVVVRVGEWASCATPVAAACPGSVHTNPTNPTFYSNYQLAALPAPAPNLCELRAIGIGRFDAFVVSDQPAALPFALPAPYIGLCDVLANVLVIAPGTPSGAVGFPADPQYTDWSLTVPPLPTGLVLHVQHLSATLGSPFWFSATNRLRIDT